MAKGKNILFEGIIAPRKAVNEFMDPVQVGIAATVIYGIVGAVKNNVPQLHGGFALLLNLALGLLFGYLGMFGLNGMEAGLMASLTSVGVNAGINKMKQ